MILAELQQILHKVNPAVVLVSPQVLERVIQQVCNLPALPWDVPHRKSYVVDRQDLFRHIEQDDLNLSPEYLLPSSVILLVRPTHEQLTNEKRETLLGVYSRRLFHASIHLTLEQRWEDGKLTLTEVRQRIEEIGQTEFAEIRQVLIEDRWIPASAPEHAFYIEFAAVFLELRYFAANLLPANFPSSANGNDVHVDAQARIEAILTRDLDAAKLFAETRPDEAADPVLMTDTSSDESHDYYWKLEHGAERAAELGNLVRAAILRTRAARVAPANLTRSTRAEAEGDMHRLAMRLETALELTRSESAEWAKDMHSLLDKADQGTRPVEADLLFDLQKVVLDAEQGIYALSLLDWVFSGGRRPIKRALPCQRQVRIIKHLRDALQRLTMARLSDTDRQHLGKLLQSALRQSEERLRVRFRPILEVALQDVGLEPSNPPERTAFYKIIEELLDRIIAGGYLTFSDLRDVISRNQLKLPDLVDPQDFVRGDPLLRLDRRLASLLDGVYRPSEIYSRALERLTALNFGTRLGRLLTTYVTLPFGGAFVVLEGVKMVIEKFQGSGAKSPGLEGAPPPAPWEMPELLNWSLFALLGFYFMALWHSAHVRQLSGQFLRGLGHLLHLVFIDVPVRLARLPPLKRFVSGWVFQFFYWFIFKPLVVCAILWLIRPELFKDSITASAIFVILVLIINHTVGHIASEILGQTLIRISEFITVGLFRGLYILISTGFKHLLTTAESVLFSVDEWMRFRTGDNRIWMGVRLILGVIWFPISYLARFYMVVLIEPGINPLKFPVSTIAAKLIYPLSPILIKWFVDLLTPFLGQVVTSVVVGSTFWLLPDIFGYLFWELKENWGLYKANRSPVLRPVAIGPHGETMLTLLEPGFHSGTIPRQFARWRRAERDAVRTGNWRVARAYRFALQELEQTVRLFAMRNLIALVHQSRAWSGQPLSVGKVALACSQIRIELLHARHPERPVWLEFEEQEGWLVAVIRQTGWIAQLPALELQPFNTALVSLYKLAGVDLVREQMHAQLPPAMPDYDIKTKVFVLWADHRYGQAIRYSWHDDRGLLKPRPTPQPLKIEAPVLDAARFMFRRVPLTWRQHVECWQKDQNGDSQPLLVSNGVELDLVGLARAHPTESLELDLPTGAGLLKDRP